MNQDPTHKYSKDTMEEKKEQAENTFPKLLIVDQFAKSFSKD